MQHPALHRGAATSALSFGPRAHAPFTELPRTDRATPAMEDTFSKTLMRPERIASMAQTLDSAEPAVPEDLALHQRLARIILIRVLDAQKGFTKNKTQPPPVQHAQLGGGKAITSSSTVSSALLESGRTRQDRHGVKNAVKIRLIPHSNVSLLARPAPLVNSL